MQNKYIDTPQAVEWESKNLPHFNSYTYFKQQLMIKNVDAIFDNPRVSIKKDKDRYIFNIDKQNAFTIAESNIERRVRQYCQEKETRKTQEDVLIKITWLKIEYIKSTTQDELDVLKVDINKQKTSEQRETSIENIKFKIERNIKFLEQEKDDSKKVKKDDKTDRLLRKSYVSQVQDRLDRLYRMKSRVELLDQHQNDKYKIKRETVNGRREIKEVEMGDINDFDKNETLKQLNEWIEDIGNEQSDFIATRNSIINKEAGTVPYYEIIINDKKDARQMQKTLKKLNNQYAILNTISLDAAKKQELAQDLQDLEEYINKVIDNPDTFKPSEHPFIPKHKDEFFKLVENDETLSKLFTLNKTKTVIPTENKPGTETDPQGQWTGKEDADKKKAGTEKAPNTYTSAGEAFEKWGINGVSKYRLDQSNMKPEQKQFRGGVWNLALTGWMVFLWWKMVSSAFKMIFKSNKEKKTGVYDWSNRAWLGIPAAVLFWSQARTGEWPMSLFKWGAISWKLANLFGRGNGTPDTNGEAKQEDVYKEGFIGLMWAFDKMTYQGMASVLEKTSEGKMKIKEDQYEGFVATLEAGNDNQKAWAKFLKKHVGKTDKNGWMDLTLRSMGITSIEDLTKDPTKDFKETAADAATRLFSVGKFMEDKWYLRINPETMSLITAYVADPKGTVDDLEKLADRGDVFETTETVTDKTGLVAKIKLIANTDTEKERLMLRGLNTFYESWPTADKTGLDIIGTWPIVEFKTYGYTTKIDMDNKKMEWLNAQTKFDSYMEMFKAANLTNRIKVICKDKQAVSEKPFYLSTPGGDITFDNAKIFSTDFDTEIMTAGWWGELKKVSSTLEKSKKEYCDYLNSVTPKFWKEQPTTT